MKYVIYCAHTADGNIVNITHNPQIDYEFIKRSHNLYGFEVISSDMDISQANYVMRSVSRHKGLLKTMIFYGGRKGDAAKLNLIKSAMSDLGIKPLKKARHVAMGEWVDELSLDAVYSLIKGRIMSYHELINIIEEKHIFTEGNLHDLLHVLYLQEKINILPSLWIDRPGRKYICMLCEEELYGYGTEYATCPCCGANAEAQDVLYFCVYKEEETRRTHIKFKDTRKLSLYQDKASYELMNFLTEDAQECLIWTVPGAEDLNIPMRAMREVLNKGGNVGVAVETEEMGNMFSSAVNSVFPDYEFRFERVLSMDITEGINIFAFDDIKRLTGAFDLLLLWDKTGKTGGGINPGLKIVRRAVKPCGKVIYMTSTPKFELFDTAQKKKMNVAAVPLRNHGKPSPEPRVMTYNTLSKDNLFIPRSVMDFITYSAVQKKYLNIIAPDSELVSLLKEELISTGEIEKKWLSKEMPLIEIKEYSADITLEQAENIIVFLADDENVFDERSLLLCAGLCGMSDLQSSGEVVYVASKENRPMEKAREMLRFLNKCAWEMGYLK
ncbi:hypothetical protein OXPF_18140 [Oxobacter pfennigii]|uniref:Uncharacterized protein n=1 Tax=Oxobacter pfennigii TaxID=36849 RepID=A0A0N8NTG0_9CLOT|nr:hypothetical protein [Oxobacter pfennigii]KPU44728.1 hypothetical protein OXPF_18140 [Oxobacter pfennigii]